MTRCTSAAFALWGFLAVSADGVLDTGFAGLDTPNPDEEPGRDAAGSRMSPGLPATKQIDVR